MIKFASKLRVRTAFDALSKRTAKRRRDYRSRPNRVDAILLPANSNRIDLQ